MDGAQRGQRTTNEERRALPASQHADLGGIAPGTRTDTWAKVQGLATFADSHGISFGRLMVARKVGDSLEVVDVSDLATREKARKMQGAGDLEALFEEISE